MGSFLVGFGPISVVWLLAVVVSFVPVPLAD